MTIDCRNGSTGRRVVLVSARYGRNVNDDSIGQHRPPRDAWEGFEVKHTDQSLLDRLRITEHDVEVRQRLFSLTREDAALLAMARPIVVRSVDDLVERFYELQTNIPDVARMIGDAETLALLKVAQREYVVELFSGRYDLDYVANRLRIGLVHKRIGVEPPLYLAAVRTLKSLLFEILRAGMLGRDRLADTLGAVDKLLLFDTSLVVDTYIQSLVSELEAAKARSDTYAMELEEKVRERTRQLEQVARADPLTGLLNVRHLVEILTETLTRARRRFEPVSFVYIDIDDFKQVNDTQGHQRGDEILKVVAEAIKKVSRSEDSLFRYGGDEFCVILPNCPEPQASRTYLSRLSAEIRKWEESVTLSVGIIQTGPDTYAEPAELIGEADERMYAVKKACKSRRVGLRLV